MSKVTPEYVGYSKNAAGEHNIIGIGPELWLRAHLQHGCELVMRKPYPGEAEFEPPPERDLSSKGGRVWP